VDEAVVAAGGARQEQEQEAAVDGRTRRVGFGLGYGLRWAVALAALTGLAAPAATPTALAQEATPVAGTAQVYPATVSVTGQGMVNVPPDTATVTVGIDVIRPDLGESQEEAARQATAIIEAVRAIGVSEQDIQTANYSVNILRDYSESGNPTDITGFEVMNQVNVTIRDIDAVGDLLDAVVGAGANSIWGVQFFVDDPRPFATEARVAAVEDAREKARQLAEAAGMELGRVVSISEGYTAQPMPLPAMGRGGGMAESSVDTPIQAGTSQITVDVSMTFELEEAAE
jgi:uncharacterized protein